MHDEPNYNLKCIELDQGGGTISYHYHNKCSETSIIVKGIGLITLHGEDKEYTKWENCFREDDYNRA